jgi:hypothetical protein
MHIGVPLLMIFLKKSLLDTQHVIILEIHKEFCKIRPLAKKVHARRLSTG